MPDKPMVPLPQIISLEQKYTHHVVDVHDVKSLQQFLPCNSWPGIFDSETGIMADRVVRCIHQKMAAYVEFWPGKVACHKIFNLSTFVLPKISCAVICLCFSATYYCVGNGPPLSLIHASVRKSPSQF